MNQQQGASLRPPGHPLNHTPISSTGRTMISSGIRLHSISLLLYTSSYWLGFCIFCIFILKKLDGTWSDTSWWFIFTPLFVGNVLHQCARAWSICTTNYRVQDLVGPPPPASVSELLQDQYRIIRIVTTVTHVVDNASAWVEAASFLIVEALFANLLEKGSFNDTALLKIFAPVWVAWAVTFLMVYLKHPTERFNSTIKRDVTNIFLVMVAFKADDRTVLSWRAVFTIPWLWLTFLLGITAMCCFTLACAVRKRHIKAAWLPATIMLLSASASIPQFAFCLRLVTRLDGDTDISYASILIPAAAGWAAMWVAAVALCWALYLRERVRRRLLATGALWTAQDVALRAQGQGEEQNRYDGMSEEELVELAKERMAEQGLTTPAALVKVGPTLYKRAAGNTDTPESEAAGASSTAAGGVSQQQSAVSAGSYGVAAVEQGAPLIRESNHNNTMNNQSAVSINTAEVSIEMTASKKLMPSINTNSSSSSSSVVGSPRATPLRTASGRNAQYSVQEALHASSSPTADQSMQPLVRSFVSDTSNRRVNPVGLTTQQAVATPSTVGSLTAGLRQSSHQSQQQQQATGDVLPELLGNRTGIPELLGLSSRQTEALQAAAAATTGDEEESVCVICFDQQSSCVLLDCGHGGYCRRCAYLLLLRPPNTCPTCRQSILQVVELEGHAAVGQQVGIRCSNRS